MRQGFNKKITMDVEEPVFTADSEIKGHGNCQTSSVEITEFSKLGVVSVMIHTPVCSNVSQNGLNPTGAKRPQRQAQILKVMQNQRDNRPKELGVLGLRCRTQGPKDMVCAGIHCQPFFISASKVAFSLLRKLLEQLIMHTTSSGGLESGEHSTNKMQRASLVAQWLRICLPMQGTRVRALVWEDPTCRGATGPVSHKY